MGVGVIVLIVLGFIVILVISLYNSLVRLRQQVKNAWSQIDVQLKRRYDLIPNLVETVKGYASHEKETFERVVQARNAALGASGETTVHDTACVKKSYPGFIQSMQSIGAELCEV